MELLINDYRIQYKESGAGDRAVVILQGWGTEMSLYDSMAASIASDYRIIQFNFPGFGGSDEPREAWSVDDYADFFLQLMDSLQINSATLIGHSYGGRVIIKLASRNLTDFSIERIVLVDSAGILPVKTPAQLKKIRRYKRLKKFYANPLIYKIFHKHIDAWRNKQGSADYRNASPMMKQCMVKAVNEDLTELLPMIKQDTLLIWGENDTATPVSDGRLMEERIPNAGLAVIQNAGHFCFLEQRVVFDRIMKSYFKIGAV